MPAAFSADGLSVCSSVEGRGGRVAKLAVAGEGVPGVMGVVLSLLAVFGPISMELYRPLLPSLVTWPGLSGSGPCNEQLSDFAQPRLTPVNRTSSSSSSCWNRGSWTDGCG